MGRDGKLWRDRKTSQEEMQEKPFFESGCLTLVYILCPDD